MDNIKTEFTYALNKDTLAGYAFIIMVTSLRKTDRKSYDKLRAFIEKNRKEGSPITETVEMKINGVSVDFVRVLEKIDEQRDIMILSEAKKLLKDI